MESEAAQKLLGPMGSTGLGEICAVVAFLSKDALGLGLFPKHSFTLQNSASIREFCADSEIGPRVSLASWLRVDCWGLCKQGLFRAFQPSPLRRSLLELVSSSGDHQLSSSAHGARGSPDPPRSYGQPWAR